MWARCIENDPNKLRGRVEGRSDVQVAPYYLTPGHSYPVLGMSMTEFQLLFLTVDDTEFPMFVPAQLFQPWSASLPPDWDFALGTGMFAYGRDLWSDPIQAIWGYPELVADLDHYAAVVAGERGARDVFSRRYKEALDRPSGEPGA